MRILETLLNMAYIYAARKVNNNKFFGTLVIVRACVKTQANE